MSTPTPTGNGTQDLYNSAGFFIGHTLIPAVAVICLAGSLFWMGLRWFQARGYKGGE